MPIVVDHSGNLPSLNALASLLLAQHQNQQADDQQQGGVQSALSQLAPILAARHGAQNQTGSYDIPSNMPPEHNAPLPGQPQYVRPTLDHQQAPADHSASVLRGILNGEQANNRLGNQDQLAQYRAGQSDQRLGERAQNQTDLEQLRDADMRSRAAEHDLPQSVVQGLQSGHMAYSPIQRNQLTSFDTWDAQVDSDPTFSEAQKARAHADIAMKRRQVLISPTLLSPDQWPISPQQQADQSSWTETDPTSGLMVRYHAGGVRNGVQQPPKIDPVSQAHLKDWEDTQKSQRELQKVQAQNANKPDAFLAQQQKLIDQQQKAALDKLKQRKPTTKQFTHDEPDPGDPDKTRPVINRAAYNAALLKWQDEYEKTSDQRFGPNLDRIANQPQHDAFDAMAAHAGILNPDAVQQSQAPVGTGGQPSQGADSGDQQPPPPAPSLSDHPEDGPAQWSSTPAGAVVTLPDGRTVRKTGDQSFEPVGDASPATSSPQFSSPDDLRQQIQSGALKSGDTIQTPTGPHTLTDDDIGGA